MQLSRSHLQKLGGLSPKPRNAAASLLLAACLSGCVSDVQSATDSPQSAKTKSFETGDFTVQQTLDGLQFQFQAKLLKVVGDTIFLRSYLLPGEAFTPQDVFTGVKTMPWDSETMIVGGAHRQAPSHAVTMALDESHSGGQVRLNRAQVVITEDTTPHTIGPEVTVIATPTGVQVQAHSPAQHHSQIRQMLWEEIEQTPSKTYL